jgi:V-type H+-transporting ATPase subunit H
MVDYKVLELCDNYSKTNIKDEDLKDDLEKVGELLEKNLVVLTSFEKYVKELD